MATTKVTAKGPIEFTDAGKQIVLPLTSMSMDASGTLTSNSPLAAAAKDQAGLTAWLKELARTGFVARAPEPPAQTAMVVTAKRAGSMGNNVSVAIANVDANAGTFDMAVSETDTWDNLTAATIATVVGMAPGGGARPGLVYVSSAGTPGVPAPVGPVPLVNAPPYQVDVKEQDGTTVAFTLAGTDNGAGVDKITIQVKNVQDPSNPASTFTLQANWPVPTVNATGKNLGYLSNPVDFAYLITIDKGPTGEFLLPAAGTVQLRGGSDGSSPTKASAAIPANG